MSLSPDVTSDLSCMDGLENISVRLSATSSALPIAGALRRHVAVSEAEASNGKYLASDVDWRLPSAALATQPPIGCTLIDNSGVEYRVLRVELATLGSCWVCHCRNLSISGDLDRLITLEHATWTKDATGAAIPKWNVVRSNLAARIQPQTGTIGVEQDRRLTRVTHRVHLAEAVTVDQDDRVVAGDEVYRVLGFEQTERIDALCCLLVERVEGALGFFSDPAAGGART